MVASSRSAMPISSLPAGGRDDRAGILRILAERDHVGGDPAHRPHEQVMQREIDQHRGDRRRSPATAAGCCARSAASPAAAAPRRARSRRSRRPSAPGRPRGSRRCPCSINSVSKASTMARSHDTLRMSMSWSIAVGMSEAASRRRCWPIFIATARAPMLLEDLPRQALRHHAARRGVEHQRGGMGGGQPVVQPVEAEIRDRRHVDQHFRDHHEQDREHEQLAGQAEAQSRACRRRRAARPFARVRLGRATSALRLSQGDATSQ